MIELSLIPYYLGISDILTELGNDNVFLHKTPENLDGSPSVKMPWIVIQTPSPGARRRLSVAFINPKRILHILCVAQDQFESLALAELVLSKTDNYRGDMYDTKDVYIRCSSIYTMDGYSGAVTSVFQATAQSLEALTKPAPVT